MTGILLLGNSGYQVIPNSRDYPDASLGAGNTQLNIVGPQVPKQHLKNASTSHLVVDPQTPGSRISDSSNRITEPVLGFSSLISGEITSGGVLSSFSKGCACPVNQRTQGLRGQDLWLQQPRAELLGKEQGHGGVLGGSPFLSYTGTALSRCKAFSNPFHPYSHFERFH